MSKRRRALPAEPMELSIAGLSHDGRGVACLDGKKLFVADALPGERVLARMTGRRRRYDEAEALEINEVSPDRVEPECPHFGVCGGCALQHLAPGRQIRFKHDTLVQNLARIGEVTPDEWFDPLVAEPWFYRRRARLSVRYVHKKGRVLVGFRERRGRFVADMQECRVLDPRVGSRLASLAELVHGLEARESIPQIEVACGDDTAALVFRHLEPLCPSDLERLADFARRTGLAVLLQPAGPDSIHALEPAEVGLAFRLPAFGLEFSFGPSDFVQVNAAMNQRMVGRAVQLLDPQPGERILDLFCGLGNFTLPLATRGAEVVGVEGDAGLVRKAADNARRNGLERVEFFAADLAGEVGGATWLSRRYDKALVDPPRSGAEGMLPHLAASGARRIVYVSCHPASLARDAGLLVRDHGFRLVGAGVMDMFPHTAHVESIALFERTAGGDR